MIDLEKESKAFKTWSQTESHVFSEYGAVLAWLERTKLAQQEIETLTSKHGSAIGKLHFTEKKLGEAQQEISHLTNANHHLNEINEDISNTILYLREKIAKYESDDYVLVPRNPSEKIKNSIDVAIKKADLEKFYSQDSVSHRKSEFVYKAMIEAGEVK